MIYGRTMNGTVKNSRAPEKMKMIYEGYFRESEEMTLRFKCC
jgi:hypothetical protein